MANNTQAAIDELASRKRCIMWAGYRSTDVLHTVQEVYPAYYDYVPDVVEVNTATGYLVVDPVTGVVTFQVPGYYRVYGRRVMDLNGSMYQLQLMSGDRSTLFTFVVTTWERDWGIAQAQISRYFAAGDTLRLSAWDDSRLYRAFVGGSAAYSRLEIEFLGN